MPDEPYLFSTSTGAQIAKLLPDDGEPGEEFGWSNAIDNGVVAVGTVYDDDNGQDSGSAYVFTTPGTGCPADINGDGLLDLADVLAFVTAFMTQQPASDFAQPEGLFDLADILAFVNASNAGCP